jgi:hypothetical protein
MNTGVTVMSRLLCDTEGESKEHCAIQWEWFWLHVRIVVQLNEKEQSLGLSLFLDTFL